MARELLILFFCATVAFLLGNGYYKSFRSGVVTIIGRTSKARTYRRDKEPISYWTSMAVGAFAFLVMVSGTAVMAFLVCADLFGSSK